jgi:hypothetical protein
MIHGLQKSMLLYRAQGGLIASSLPVERKCGPDAAAPLTNEMKISGTDALSDDEIEITFSRTIECVERAEPWGLAGERTYLAPAWIDLQVNGFAGVDYNSPETPQEAMRTNEQIWSGSRYAAGAFVYSKRTWMDFWFSRWQTWLRQTSQNRTSNRMTDRGHSLLAERLKENEQANRFCTYIFVLVDHYCGFSNYELCAAFNTHRTDGTSTSDPVLFHLRREVIA